MFERVLNIFVNMKNSPSLKNKTVRNWLKPPMAPKKSKSFDESLKLYVLNWSKFKSN